MKKFIYGFLILIISCLILTPRVEAGPVPMEPIDGGVTTTKRAEIGTFDPNRPDDFDKNCHDFAGTIRIGGILLFIVKIMLPVVIIIKATMSFVSVVTSGKPDDLKKKANKLMISLIAAIIIFFLPTIVNTLFGFIARYNDNITEDSKVCSACIFEPFSSECSSHINAG